MKTNSTTILIIATACVAAGLAYWYLVPKSSTEPSLTTSGQDNAAKAEFQMLVAQLPSSFDTSIFNDERLLALHDLTVAIVDEPIGRTDPFAPIPGVSSE